MKKVTKVTPITLAIAALLSGSAWAQEHAGHEWVEGVSDGKVSSASNWNSDSDTGTTTRRSVITNENITERKVDTGGYINVGGYITVNSDAAATISDQQINYQNVVNNEQTSNAATIDGNSATDVKGNLGINVAGGDNNQQANAAALSATDASFVFGSAAANISARQDAQTNVTTNQGTDNLSTLGGGSLVGVSGNVGVNIAAGNSNQQKNDLAASTAVSVLSNATVTVKQMSDHNVTTNARYGNQEVRTATTSLQLGATGRYAGINDQNGNQYLDIWNLQPHPGDGNIGHVDVDSSVQGASDRPQPDKLTNPSYSHGGGLSFNEAGELSLQGTVTGSIPVIVAVNKYVNNHATLGSGSLANVTGNVGVNIASGSGNQQYNGLAIAAAQAPRGNPNPNPNPEPTAVAK